MNKRTASHWRTGQAVVELAAGRNEAASFAKRHQAIQRMLRACFAAKIDALWQRAANDAEHRHEPIQSNVRTIHGNDIAEYTPKWLLVVVGAERIFFYLFFFHPFSKSFILLVYETKL